MSQGIQQLKTEIMEKLITLIAFIFIVNINAQVIFQSSLISDEIGIAWDITYGDIDGDGDLDVIATYVEHNIIVWHENTDGLGSFGPQRIIDPILVEGWIKVKTADIDEDGKVDVIASSREGHFLAWYRNEGSGNFSAQKIIAKGRDAGYSTEIYFSDIDSDGHIDIAAVHGTGASAETLWYENDGSGNFTRHVVSTYPGALSITVKDVDDDGDPDIICVYNTNASTGSRLAWFENTDGLGSFGPMNTIAILEDPPQSIQAADFDNDGDIDVALLVYSIDAKIVWYKNTDGFGTFSSEIIIEIFPPISEGIAFGKTGIADFDGDMDIFYSYTGDAETEGEIHWAENNGSGSFTIHTINDNIRNYGLCAADINGDGKIDILSASWDAFLGLFPNNNELLFFKNTFKNTLILGVEDNILKDSFKMYPNPVADILNFSSRNDITSVNIFTLLGQEVLSYTDDFGISNINISNLSSGIYIGRFGNETGGVISKQIIKKGYVLE